MAASVYDELFRLDPSGLLHFYSSEIVIDRYQIYISAYNGEVWGPEDGQYLFRVTYSPPPADVLPSVRPVFVGEDADNLVFQVEEAGEDPIEYELPEVYDANDDPVAVSVANLPSFMTFNETSVAIQIHCHAEEACNAASPNYTAEVTLEDIHGKTSSYEIEIDIGPCMEGCRAPSSTWVPYYHPPAENLTTEPEPLEVGPDEELRDPIEIEIVDFNVRGEISLLFSE